MERISRPVLIILTLFVIIVSSCGGPPAIIEKPKSHEVSWYTERYPFMENWGKMFTFDSEFDWPIGYSRPDSSVLSPFSFWASNFPLWPADHDVASLEYGLVFRREEICRSVHMLWRTPKFRDDLIPLQMLAEYYRYRDRALELKVIPLHGDTLSYLRWLESRITFDAHKAVTYNPVEKRPDSKSEYDGFVNLCARVNSYRSLIINCVAVDSSEVVPGDLFISRNNRGGKGKVYVVLCMLTNKKKDRIYAVATGCERPCDFYIPIVNGSRTDPWMTVQRIEELGAEFDNSGFYRLRFSDF